MTQLRAPRPAALHAGATLVAVHARRGRGHAAVIEHQLRRVRALVRHAAQRVPGYAGHLAPDDADRIRSFEDLQRLPIIDKAHFLRLDPEARAWPVAHAGGRTLFTSGTSGEPFAVPWSAAALWRNEVQRLVMMRGMRIGPVDRQVAVVMSSRARGAREARAARSGLARLLAGRRISLAEDRSPPDLAEALVRLDPAWVTGEPHSLVSVGEALYGRLRPKTLTTYGVALDGVLRAELEQAFGTAPLDIYGCSEAGQVAWQCRAADLYHVNHEIALLEIVDEAGRPVPLGEPGDLLITGLLNPLLPMVRYRIGDGAAWADRRCACGSASPALSVIAGRVFDWLIDDRGNRVAPQRLWMGTLVGRRAEHVRRYRMAQDADGGVLVEIDASPQFDEHARTAVRDGVLAVLGRATPVEVQMVNEVRMPRSGRFRQFTSERSRRVRRSDGPGGSRG